MGTSYAVIDLYRTLQLVEKENAEMKTRQQTILSTYQQQTREDIAKKFVDADHKLLEAAEQKIKEINSLQPGTPYLVTGARKTAYVSVRRVESDADVSVEIDPIIYPTAYNLKFTLREPSVGLYSPSNTKGVFSVNATTPVRAVNAVESLQVDELEQYLDLWITHRASNTLASKLKNMEEKLRSMQDSAGMVVESMLMMSSPRPPRELIYYCEEHDKEPTHRHERTVPASAVKGLMKSHLKV